jgi:16S rRNA (guanine966-N2)-methyltransferase
MVNSIRIGSGTLKNRKLLVPPAKTLRPTGSRARGALFNRLQHSFSSYNFKLDGANVADLFSGTGALGIEALSHGATHVTFVDKDKLSIQYLRENINLLNISLNAQVLPLDVMALPKSQIKYDLVFLDPPYGKSLVKPAIETLIGQNWLKKNTLLVIESEKNANLNLPEGFEINSHRTYGISQITFVVLATLF